jgi:hypothetical protein
VSNAATLFCIFLSSGTLHFTLDGNFVNDDDDDDDIVIFPVE